MNCFQLRLLEPEISKKGSISISADSIRTIYVLLYALHICFSFLLILIITNVNECLDCAWCMSTAKVLNTIMKCCIWCIG